MSEASHPTGPLFIVGNSRSGTTLLMRAFNGHSEVHAVNEPHFWERLYLPEEKGVALNKDEQLVLMNRLICSQRQTFQKEENIAQYTGESEGVLNRLDHQEVDKLDVYEAFLKYETQRVQKRIALEKTPRNVFYIKELLERFPNARVIVITRDPRAILLSQKNKWKRGQLGSEGFPLKEQMRLRLNYHPVVMSKLWLAGVKAADVEDSRIHRIRFEDFVREPQNMLEKLCGDLGIAFEAGMLNVPQASSSMEKDLEGATGFRKKDSQSWKKHLNATEMVISDRMTAAHRSAFDYEDSGAKSNALLIAWYYLLLPFKLSLALFFNLGKYRNILKTLKSRL